MTTITREVRVGPDGNVTVPVGKDGAGQLVRVTIEPARSPQALTEDEWRAFLERTAGKWSGDFPEPDDPPPAERDQL